MANIKIRLVVDTNKIRKGDVDAHCYLIDNMSKADRKQNPIDHVTMVDQAQTVEWSGVPKSPDVFDEVSIDSITYKKRRSRAGKKDKNLFGVPYLVGYHGVINATVIAKGFLPDDEEYYNINFTVIKANGKSSSFTIDPKMKMKR